MRCRVIVTVLVAALTLIGDAAAQGRRPSGPGLAPSEGAGGADANPLFLRAPREVQERAGLIETGLVPVFPREARCPPIASPFASRTRYDGSSRRGEANYGFHAGTDISSAEGTPLLAVADGVVIEKREVGMMGGIQIFLQHSPDDTGFSLWLYSKYQPVSYTHLRAHET